MITYASCPCCLSKNIRQQLSVKDYTVSKQLFDVWECTDCTLRFTQNIPEEAAIGDYYKAENYISHTDTKKGFVNKLYHLVRNTTLKSKCRLVGRYTGLDQGHVLDIGAGTGAFLAAIRDRGWGVKGIEPDAKARDLSIKHHILPLEGPEKLPDLSTASFEAVTLWHVLEHVHNLHGYMEQIKRILTPGGKAFIAVPNYTSYDANVYKEHWAAYDVPRHLYHFSPTAMKHLLKRHGLKLITSVPMWYDSFYVSMLSEQYKTGRSNYIRAIFNGFISDIKTIFNKEKCSSLIYIITQE